MDIERRNNTVGIVIAGGLIELYGAVLEAAHAPGLLVIRLVEAAQVAGKHLDYLHCDGRVPLYELFVLGTENLDERDLVFRNDALRLGAAGHAGNHAYDAAWLIDPGLLAVAADALYVSLTDNIEIILGLLVLDKYIRAGSHCLCRKLQHI